MVKKRIAFCTGTRAEYGLLKPLMDRVIADTDLDFELYVTGMHLSPEFGNTVTLIEADGLPVTERVEILLSGDTPSAITKSMGLAMIGFGDVFARRKPDMVVILGDRFEAFCVAAAATVARVPIAHIHGGELTEGLIDEAIRHSITKMASFHFVSTNVYKKRVIQLGENPETVFSVGALGIDLIKEAKFASDDEVTNNIPILRNYEKSILVTIHPETLTKNGSEINLKKILAAVDLFEDVAFIFTGTNADTDGRIINSILSDYCSYHSNCIFYKSLGTYLYLGVMRKVNSVLGNSSSGILEAPAMGVPSVDIGSRQLGRVLPSTVIHCDNDTSQIVNAINKVLLPKNIKTYKLEDNPYWFGGASEKIFLIIKEKPIPSVIKRFYDLP